MELASDIVKENVKYENLEYIIDFKKLNIKSLTEKVNYNKFSKKIKSFEPVATNFISIFFNSNVEELADAILFAYCILAYSYYVFDEYKLRFEEKLFSAATNVIYYIEKIINKYNKKSIETINENIADKLISTVDHYFSLFKIWKSKESLNELGKIYETVEDLVKTKHNDKKEEQIEKYIYQMLEYNFGYATKILLQNYEIFGNFHNLKTKFWNDIQHHNNQNSMVILIIAELRIKLIKMIRDSNIKKELYYKIDIENMIKKIRQSTFDVYDIYQAISIFLNSIRFIDQYYQIQWDQYLFNAQNKLILGDESNNYFSEDDKISNIFRCMYNFIYQHN
jgi:hypothetical protein